MEQITDERVRMVFEQYPNPVKKKLLFLRALILDTAANIDATDPLEETLKWGEPSYLAKNGSTIRIDWKEKDPEHYAIYFKCTSKLVPTFKELYSDVFRFEGDRALLFELNAKIPEKELRHCITMALLYHKLKHLPLLGASQRYS
ncbi:DUF1801 domain-containing protein [Sungkyunkwania multivorans]|uniref:DUF1801 domain-containing protein n=1 Tax=Sungkyunkwania multivorans TaxID=1173618 RepID=A0ABW3CWT6_9FLAO